MNFYFLLELAGFNWRLLLRIKQLNRLEMVLSLISIFNKIKFEVSLVFSSSYLSQAPTSKGTNLDLKN